MSYISREEKNGITINSLKELFEYKNGGLYHKHSFLTKSNIKIGERAGRQNENGYRIVSINSNSYREHRLIFLLHYGFVSEFIDHKDNDRKNNLISNLRCATKNQNSQNSKIRIDNTTGVKGLSYNDIYKNPWIANLYKDKKYILRKRFKTKQEAIEALDKARKEHHGEFANKG